MMRSGSTGAFEDYQLRSRTDIDFVTWAALEKQAIRDRLAGLRKQRQQAELRRLAAAAAHLSGLSASDEETDCGSDVDELLSKLAL